MRSPTVLSLSTLVLGALLAATLAAPAQAATATAGLRASGAAPEITAFVDLVVDESHDRVFVSQGAAGIQVFDLDGVYTTTLTGLGGGDDLLLSGDDSTLYVAGRFARQVVAVDSATLAVTRSYATGDDCPAALAQADDVLWMASRCGTPELAALDLTTGEVTASEVPVTVDNPLMTTSPRRPGLIAYVSEHDYDDQISIYDASIVDGTPVLTERVTTKRDVDAGQIAISGNGNQLLVAEGGYTTTAYSVDDLAQPRASYEGGTAAAVRADGEVATGSIALTHAGTTLAWRHYQLPDAGRIRPGGLAWGAVRLYAVTHDTHGFHLSVITPRAASSLKLSVPRRTYPYDFGSSISVRVTLKSDSPNRAVRIYSVPGDGSRSLVSTGTVTSARSVIRVRATRSTTLVVVYGGDDTTDGAQAGVDVEVRATASSTFVRPVRTTRRSDGEGGRPTTAFYHSGSTAKVVATVGAYDARCALFVLSIQRDGRQRTTYTSPCLRPDEHDHIRLKVPSTKGASYYRTRVTVLVKADGYNEQGSGYDELQFCAGKIPC